MAGKDDKAAREARLAAKLRENLRRRKAQSRALDNHKSGGARPDGDARGLPKGDGES